jgi:3-methyladenine DNA glycosylase AlkD
MKTSGANALGDQLAELLAAQQPAKAYAILAPYLTQKISFATLDKVGVKVGAAPIPIVNDFLDRVVAGAAMGGWPIVGKALAQQLGRDSAGAFARCRTYILSGDTWYATDILGERLHGTALVTEFNPTLKLLAAWRTAESPWVRRSLGVGVHVWAKRSKGRAELIPQAKQLFNFLEPLFDEREIDAIKGIGWGLKTLGRYYPEVAADWLTQAVVRHPHYRALMLRKALTYLPTKACKSIEGHRSHL